MKKSRITRQLSLWIHLTKPTVSSVLHFVFAWNLFYITIFEKRGRMDVRTTCAKTIITTDRDWGLASWIKWAWGNKTVAYHKISINGSENSSMVPCIKHCCWASFNFFTTLFLQILLHSSNNVALWLVIIFPWWQRNVLKNTKNVFNRLHNMNSLNIMNMRGYVCMCHLYEKINHSF